ncbi:MAG: hypothetical protein LC797_17195 [Chloroflexi bacterium]|nr:hypothetical protein [Chloroflexota bacterium]
MEHIGRMPSVEWLARAYCSDLSYFLGLVVLWEVLVLLAAAWLVPVVLDAAAATGIDTLGAVVGPLAA